MLAHIADDRTGGRATITHSPAPTNHERRAIVVHGIVQGVGFRPFVFGLAARLQLGGFVKNQSGSVIIEVEGDASLLDRFVTELAANAPPLAQLERLAWERCSPRGDRDFRIESSDSSASAQVFISPDVATCDDCLRELFDPNDRRFRYPFLNCTNCGPRLTIITGAPYDRPKTTMAAFQMCRACRAEYEDPSNRRFHAQPTACPECGPRLRLLDASGEVIEVIDPITEFVNRLRTGAIGALKGLGGYHLACDARNETAVRELRRRKHRDEKPFALMVSGIAQVETLCEVNDRERDLLLSPRRPIVLLRIRDSTLIADVVAPGNPYLGVMLPYTPLHHLLVRSAGTMPLVMTSGNRSDEPIAYRDDEALTTLTGIADLFLIHDRPIHVRCDDSVTRVVDDVELPVRRSRGYAPRPIKLPFECPQPILATGGQLKATFALGHGRQAFVSHHMGDLDDYEAYRAYVRDIGLYEELFGIRPTWVVHDLHPDYATTQYARERGTPLLAVQHHHAHMASCMAEHLLSGPVIGVSFDGTGYGTDGAIWGGEFLVGDYRGFRRVAHLRYASIPGGDRAIREPWRMAIVHLKDAECRHPILEGRRTRSELGIVARMLEGRLNSPLTSSMGRLFDAVASLIGLRDTVSYEGQAAMELEWLAWRQPPAGEYPLDLTKTADCIQVDTRPLVASITRDLMRGIEPAVIARRFHTTLVNMVVNVCDRLQADTGIDEVVLSGGVFMNALLTTEVCSELREREFNVYRHGVVPPNDGGLSLGQLAIAAAMLS